MPNSERENLIRLLTEYQESQIAQNADFRKSLEEINKKLDPVFEVYSTYAGFGRVAMGFFKWVIVPVSIVLGIIISIKKIWLE